MALSNNAAYLVEKGKPLKIQPSKVTSPGKNKILVKNSALAINPYDWIIQAAHNLVVPWSKLPLVLGTDIAGTVVEVGEGVNRFKIGDRVIAHALGLAKEVNNSCEAGFQEYTITREHMTSVIPDSMSFEVACVIPLGLSTAATALYQKDLLSLDLPSTSSKPKEKTLLVWGGSTSVGCNAIQLAVASGYKVITTASPKHHNYLKSLGASEVFDYKSKTVVIDIIESLRGKTVAGAISIAPGSFAACVKILASCQGNKFVAQATLDMPPFPTSTFGTIAFVFSFMTCLFKGKVQTTMSGVGSKMINGSDLAFTDVGRAIYCDYLPRALEMGKFVPSPEPQIIGKGLDLAQQAMNINKQGVSAQKVVITL